MTVRQVTSSDLIVALDRDEKLSLIASVILEITFLARSKYSDDPDDGAGIFELTEKVNRATGYLLKIVDREAIDEEGLLASTLAAIIDSVATGGMKKLAAHVQESSHTSGK